VSVSVTDLAGNTINPYSWTFGVQEPECGQAEFYGLESSNTVPFLFVNSQTSIKSGALVAAYNPFHKELSWLENTRIKNITLLHRKTGAANWLVALDTKGFPAEFFDDVSETHRLCTENVLILFALLTDERGSVFD
jgi:hypothetical protein